MAGRPTKNELINNGTLEKMHSIVTQIVFLLLLIALISISNKNFMAATIYTTILGIAFWYNQKDVISFNKTKRYIAYLGIAAVIIAACSFIAYGLISSFSSASIPTSSAAIIGMLVSVTTSQVLLLLKFANKNLLLESLLTFTFIFIMITTCLLAELIFNDWNLSLRFAQMLSVAIILDLLGSLLVPFINLLID